MFAIRSTNFYICFKDNIIIYVICFKDSIIILCDQTLYLCGIDIISNLFFPCFLGRDLLLTYLFDPQKLPSRSADVKDQKVEPTELPQDELLKSGNWSGLGTVHGSSGCRQVIRSRGGARPRKRSQKKIHGSRSESGRRSIKINKTSTRVLMKQGEGTYGQGKGQEQGTYEQGLGHGRGPRTVRRRRESKTVEEMQHGHFGDHGSLGIRESPRNTDEEEWVGEKIGKMQDEGADNSNSTEESESDDNADPTRYGDRRWEPEFNVASHRSTWDTMEMSDEDADGVDINVYEEDDDNLEEDVDMNDGLVGNNGESSETSGDYSD